MAQLGNPYRGILRRDYPEPFIALLAFILGIWMWDHYFGKHQGYEPGTEEVALVKIDRDLRLADSMAEDPAWLRWMAAVDEPVVARRNALEVFEKMAKEGPVSPRTLEAYAIVKSVQDGLPLGQTLNTVLQGQSVSGFEETSRELANHQGTWWQAKLIETWEKNVQPGSHWRQSYGQDCIQLKTRAVVVRGAIWVLGAMGLIFLPGAVFRLRHGWKVKPKGYGGAWPLSLGLVIFQLATLAWIGFTLSLELGISAIPGLPPITGIFLDTAARLLPALIAVGLLFRQPRHAVRVMGANRPIAMRTILGLFALLLVVDQILRAVLGNTGSGEPGGGLSMGDAGLWGLAFAIVSACIVAPIAEETLYRGVLFRAFWNRLGLLPAAVLSSVIFAMLHFYDGYGFASVGVFGFTCALVYASTGSLSTVIVFHMFYNASIKIPEWIVYHAPLG